MWRMRIAAVDDDETQLEEISRVIRGAGHICLPFSRPTPLLTTLRRESFDLLVIDWNMPEMSGQELMRWMHEHLSLPPPILMLTSRSSESDVVAGLEAGADDYVIKPFQPDVLVARISALLRRVTGVNRRDHIEVFEEYSFDAANEAVWISGKPVSLTSKEFALALLLFRNIHRPLSRAHLLEMAWGRNPTLPTRTLDMHISRVRTKLDLRPEHGFRLMPVYSFGYRLERVSAVPAVQI
jgi:DNA-binding response OmpR family regulator